MGDHTTNKTLLCKKRQDDDEAYIYALDDFIGAQYLNLDVNASIAIYPMWQHTIAVYQFVRPQRTLCEREPARHAHCTHINHSIEDTCLNVRLE